MKVGVKNRKQLVIMSALLALALVVFSRNVLNVGASAPAPVAEKTPALQEERGRQSASLHNSLDPSIRLDLLRSSESTEYKGNGRNIFKSMPEIPQPVAPPIKAQPIGPPPKPAPPPISLKFYGFASSAGGNKQVFLSQGDDIFIAKEGDIVDRRYKVIHIGPNSVDIEDVLENNTQPIPLTQGPVPGQGPGA